MITVTVARVLPTVVAIYEPTLPPIVIQLGPRYKGTHV